MAEVRLAKGPKGRKCIRYKRTAKGRRCGKYR